MADRNADDAGTASYWGQIGEAAARGAGTKYVRAEEMERKSSELERELEACHELRRSLEHERDALREGLDEVIACGQGAEGVRLRQIARAAIAKANGLN